MKRLIATMITAAALLLGSASAQYGYPPYDYSYGYQPMMPGASYYK